MHPEKCGLLLFQEKQQVQIIVFPILTLSHFRESRLSASPQVCNDYIVIAIIVLR